MKPVVIIWLVIFILLLVLLISRKDGMESTTATVLESDCVLVKGARPCVAKVKYNVNGQTLYQQLVVKPTRQALVGGVMPIRYNPFIPNQVQEYKFQLNIFTIPTVVWVLFGAVLLYLDFSKTLSPLKIR
jgi:hypothetical protein